MRPLPCGRGGIGKSKYVDEKRKYIEFAISLDCSGAFTIGVLNDDDPEEVVALMDACVTAA